MGVSSGYIFIGEVINITTGGLAPPPLPRVHLKEAHLKLEHNTRVEPAWGKATRPFADATLGRGPFSTSSAAPVTTFGSAGLSWSTVELPLRRDLTEADRSISCGAVPRVETRAEQ